MAFIQINIPPGLERNGTPFDSVDRYWDRSLMRWISGSARPVGGWTRRTSAPLGEAIRRFAAWRTNDSTLRTIAATETKLYVDFSGAWEDITPAGIGRWSDGELARALTSGVSADGRALFPLMNFPAYSAMCERDLHAVMGYVRTLAPIEHKPPQSKLDFPLNLIARTLPTPAGPAPRCPEPSDGVAQGKYLATLAGCVDCHTRHENGGPVAGQEFAGGATFCGVTC